LLDTPLTLGYKVSGRKEREVMTSTLQPQLLHQFSYSLRAFRD